MKKTISLFARNYEGDRLVRDEIVPGAEWVIAGEGTATRKYDGTCCMVRDGKLWKRYDAKAGKSRQTSEVTMGTAQVKDNVLEEKKLLYEADKRYVHALLERLATEAEPALLLKRDEYLHLSREEYRNDLAGFEFECRRWGAFMTISTRRKNNVEAPSFWGKVTPKEFSTSLNIKSCSAIRLVLGHPPDENGAIDYWPQLRSDSGNSRSGANGHRLPESGWHYEIVPILPHIPQGRPLFKLNEKRESRFPSSFSIYDEQYRIQFKTRGFPQAAKDDEIHFDGLDATLFVPAGKGREVNEQILLATEGMQ